MKILKVLVYLIIAAAVIAALWYFRPWSQFSPANFADLQKPEKLTYNFTHMADIVPSRELRKSSQPRAILVADQADLLALEYSFNGKEKTIAQFVDESETLGLIVIKNGEIQFEDYFQTADENSLFTSWSMAKSFVATSIAMAVKDGLIASWEDPAHKYAPQYMGSAFGDSSIKSLMMMATGVKFDEDYASKTSDINPFFFDSFILQKDPDSLLMKFDRSRPEFTDFQYISPNSHVLSAVLRGVYKKPLAEIIQEQIWEPFGMASDANWLQHKEGAEGQALGYCCLNATLKDYARFGLFHLEAQQGEGLGMQELPADWISKLPVPASENHVKGGEKYSERGYSWHFWLPPSRDGVFFAAGVYGQFIWIEPDQNLVIVRNSSDPDWTPRFLESEATLMAISDFFADE